MGLGVFIEFTFCARYSNYNANNEGCESAKSVAMGWGFAVCRNSQNKMPRVVACEKIPFSSFSFVLEELFLTHLHGVGSMRFQQREF